MSLGLAPLIVERLLAMLQDMASSTGCAVLLVEQPVQQALSIADSGYVLRRGQVVLDGPVEVLARETALLEASLLGPPGWECRTGSWCRPPQDAATRTPTLVWLAESGSTAKP